MNFIRKSPKKLLEEKVVVEEGRDLKLGEMLIKAGKLTDDQLNAAIMNQKMQEAPLGEIIVRMGFLSEAELRVFLSEQREINEIDLEKFEIDFSLVKKVGKAFCLKYRIVPLEYVEIEKEKIFRFAVASKEDMHRLKSANLLKDIVLIAYLAKKEKIDALLDEIKSEDVWVLK